MNNTIKVLTKKRLALLKLEQTPEVIEEVEALKDVLNIYLGHKKVVDLLKHVLGIYALDQRIEEATNDIWKLEKAANVKR